MLDEGWVIEANAGLSKKERSRDRFAQDVVPPRVILISC